MKTIRLKSNTPLHVTRRTKTDKGYEKRVIDWDFEHGFVQDVELDYWDWLQDQYVDSRLGVQYKNLLKPI